MFTDKEGALSLRGGSSDVAIHDTEKLTNK